MRKRLLLGALTACALLAACDDRPTTWKAYVYPDRENMDRVLKLDGFVDLKSCQVAAFGTLAFLDRISEGDYECGYRCAPKADFGGLDVCAETRR